MRQPRPILWITVCLLSACGPGWPDIDTSVSPRAQAAAFPELRPLGPILSGVEADLSAPGIDIAASLEARAADLRRRAAALRALPL